MGLSLGVAIATILPLGLHAAPLDILKTWDFNAPGNLDGWEEPVGQDNIKGALYDAVTNPTAEMDVVGGSLVGKVILEDPKLEVDTTSLTLSANQIGYVKMRYRTLVGAGDPLTPPSANISIISPANDGNVGSASAPPNTSLVDDAVNGWYINTWDFTKAYGTSDITTLRIDPVDGLIDGGNGTFEIDYIQVLETDTPPPVLVEIDPGPIDPSFVLVKEWNSDADWGVWTVNAQGTLSVAGGEITATSNPADPGPGSDLNLSISTANFNATGPTTGPIPAPQSGTYVLEYRVSQNPAASGSFQTFWADANGGINGARSVVVSAPAGDAVFHVYRVALTDQIANQLTGLRLDPNNQPASTSVIDYFRVYVNPAPVGWDTNIATAPAQGGSGTWNTTNPFFYTGFVNKSWVQGADAIFGATAGTVTVDAGGIEANDIAFRTTGYSLTGGTLTLSGATSTLSGETGVATIINAPLSRSSSVNTDLLNVTGPGSFSFGGGGSMTRKWHFKTDASLTAGTFDSSGTTNASNGLCVYNSSTLTLAGATVNRTNGDGDDALYIGNPANTGEFAGSSRAGNLIVNSGNLNVLNGRSIAIAFGGSNNSVMTVNGGSVVSDQLFVGWNGAGTLNITGGTVSVKPDDASTTAVRHTDGGSGTINLSGGELRAGSVWLGIGGSNATVPLDVNLDSGGTLQTERIRISTGPGAGTYTLTCNFDGGVLKLPAIAPTGSTGNILGDISMGTGASTAIFTTIIEDGGLIMNTNGRDTTINTVLEHDALGPALDGGLTKNGLGTLTLAQPNTYTGQTRVNAGILAVNGTSINNSGKVNIAGGKILIPAATNEVVDTLFFNGVPQPAGTYGSTAAAGPGVTTNNTFFDVTGSGTLTVNFTGIAGGYTTWAEDNADGQSADLDFDLDGTPNGVEYFMGATGSTFTPNPPLVTTGSVRTVTWTKDPAYAGTFKIQTSETLAIGGWTDIVPPDASINTSNPNQVVYTLPAGPAKKFVRLNVTVAP